MRTFGARQASRTTRSRRRSRRLVLLLVAVVSLAGSATVAWSYWSGFGAPLQGTGVAGGVTVNRGAAPAVSAINGTSAALSWGASTLSDGEPVDGYVVKRYDSSTGTLQPLGAGCSGTITTRSCTETGVPTGAWRYTVTPVLASNWRGTESSQSGMLTIGAATLTLAKTAFGAPLPATTTGTVTGFAPGESISYSVSGTATTGSPTTVDATGSATISTLTIPTVAEGSRTVRVTGGSSGLVASVGILVDTAPPVLSSTVTPTPNAAGWNRTPVQVTPSADDGSGSGLDFVKLTSDGSDPRTSPTAQVYAGEPLELAATTTVKYYAVDRAGNASAVQTLPVSIDMIPPTFYPQMVDITGGAVITVLPPHPGVAYYRGIAAGSFRFRITLADTGGSGAASLATSSLVDLSTGFTHEPGTGAVVGGVTYTNPFSWVAGTTSSPTGNVTVTDVAGNTTTGGGALHDDSIAPVGGSVDATGLGGSDGRYSASTTLQLALASGSDDASGLAATGRQLLRAAAPLSAGDGSTTNGVCGSYGAYVQVGANDPASAVADTVPTTPSCYRYRYLVPDQVGNVATNESPDIKVAAAPAPAVRPSDATITPVSGIDAQAVSGSTVFYNPAQAGSFNVDSSAGSPFVGIDRMSFPTIAGFTGGGDTVSPSGTTYRSTYSWSANGISPSPGAQTLTATDNAGGSLSNPTAFSVVKDDVGPGGGAVNVAGLGGTGGRYSTSTTLSLALVAGNDGGSGLATSGRTLRRASASLTSNGTVDGACGSFGAYAPIAADPASPRTDTVPVDGTCYRYQYVVSDNVGNQAVYTSADVKVEAAAPPVPVLAFSNLTNASVTGNAVFYRPGATSGGFTVTASSSDLISGTTGIGFPTLPAGWSSSAAGSGARTYSWSAPNPTVPTGNQTVTTTNNAGRQSSSSFTVAVTSDSTPPSGGSVSYTNGYSTNAAVNVSFTKGTDSGSGLAGGSGLLQRASATLANGACGSFGGFSTVATNPTSAYSDPVTTGCYQYRYLIADNVGNQATYTTSSVVKVDQNPPSNTISITSATGAYSAFGGATLFYKGDAPGSFRYVDALADAESGPASVDFPSLATSGWTHAAETVSTPAGGPYVSSTYSWTTSPGTPPLIGVVGRDNAGKIWSAAITFVSDVTAPVDTAVNYANGLVNATTLPVSLTNGNDGASGSGIDPATTVLRRDVATLDATTQICGTFPGTYATTVSLVGGNDTGLTSGRCYRYRYTVSDRVGNTTTVTSPNVAKIDTSGPRVTAITSFQSNGTAGNGRLQIGDRLVLTFNQNLATATVPTSFSGATETSPGVFSNVLLTVPGLTDGAVDTGSLLYMPAFATATFGGTISLSNNGTATTVTLTVTSLTGTAPTTSSGRLELWPATTIQDQGGNPALWGFATAISFRLF